MNPAEEIVKYWLQTKGYFLQSSIRLPQNREIDILAIHENGEHVHFEVAVSVRMANYKANAQELAKIFCDKKFLAVQDEASSRLGKKYKRKFVVGKVSKGTQDIRSEFITACKGLGLEVLKFEDILTEVAATLSTHTHLNPVIKAVQLTTIFLKT